MNGSYGHNSISGTGAASILLLMICLSFSTVEVSAQEKDGGFGVNKDNVTFVLTHPPKLLITQKTYSLHVNGTQSAVPALVSALKPVINRAKSGINYVPDQGELRINLDLFFDYSQNESRRKLKVTKTDEKTKEQKEVEEVHRFITVQSAFEISWDFQDWTGGQPTTLDSGRMVAPKINQELDVTATEARPTSEIDARSAGISQFTTAMFPIFNETSERVEVILGRVKDDLKAGNSLAEASNWKGALQAWAAVPTYEFPKAESYRVYNLGVANEALAHLAFSNGQDVNATLKYLVDAREMYQRALTLKPNEKFFKEAWRGNDPPLRRIDKAIQAYAAWKARKEALQTANRGAVDDLLDAPSQRTRSVGNRSGAPAARGDGISNNEIIEMAKAGASDEFIADTIASADRTNFDLSVQGKIALLKGGVSERIIRLMEQKQKQQ